MGTVLAASDVPAEGHRSAALDGAHHLELAEADVTGVGGTPGGPVVAEDVRDLQHWTGHVGRLRGRLGLPLRHQWREPVDRAHHLRFLREIYLKMPTMRSSMSDFVVVTIPTGGA